MDCRVEKRTSRQGHVLENAGSNPAPATNERVLYHGKILEFSPKSPFEILIREVVIDLNTACIMSDLGINTGKRSLFTYEVWGPDENDICNVYLKNQTVTINQFPAYTVGELIEILQNLGFFPSDLESNDISKPNYWVQKIMEAI